MYLLTSATSISSSFASVSCEDGWVSNSTGSGTCSHHGGIFYDNGVTGSQNVNDSSSKPSNLILDMLAGFTGWVVVTFLCIALIYGLFLATMGTITIIFGLVFVVFINVWVGVLILIPGLISVFKKIKHFW